MAQLSKLPKINIRGPFWEAEADLIEIAKPDEHWSFRTLFADITPRHALDEDHTLVPGTLITLCWVRRVRISPNGPTQAGYVWKRSGGKIPTGSLPASQLRTLIRSGEVALLVLQAPVNGWPDDADEEFPELVCLGGEISLDVLKPESSAHTKLLQSLALTPADKGERSGAAQLFGTISVHGSGLSIFGSAALPWQTTRVSGPFLLARLFPDPVDPATNKSFSSFRLIPEVERMTDAEREAMIEAALAFSRIINPRFPLNGLTTPGATPIWTTLELSDPLTIPRVFWAVAPWQTAPTHLPLHFVGDQLTVLLADQQPYDQAQPPATLARIVPNELVVTRTANGMQVDARAGTLAAEPQQLRYSAQLAAGNWQEQLTLTAMEIAPNAVAVAQAVRSALSLPEPEWAPDSASAVVDPDILWAWMPLADGWAQLPVPNLTEQIYLDAEAAQPAAKSGEQMVVQGAVTWGNDRREVLTAHPDEQPWNITLTNGHTLEGRWIVEQVASAPPAVVSVSLTIGSPDIFVDGFFWLSTGAPSAADAIPDHTNWVAGVRSVPLRPVHPATDLYPPVLKFALPELHIALRTSKPDQPEPMVSALLGNWSLAYRVDAAIFKHFVSAGVMRANAFSAYPALVWRRHATLPMIQALPLTQTLEPPHYPSASRQLVPYALPTVDDPLDHTIKLPADWKFGTTSADGAAQWPELQSAAQPAPEWASLADLPLVALSLPGLVLDPKPEEIGLQQDSETGLALQYRWDLPYADQLHALAQLPKIPRDPNVVSPLPDAPRPEPPRPLTRETMHDHWRRLSERASLASVDAATMLAQQNGTMQVRNMVEPLSWPVRATFALGEYPGVLVVDNADPAASAPLRLEAEDALRGVDGRFSQSGDTLTRLVDGTNGLGTPFVVTAGSMAAHTDGNGKFRDQRGLLRGSTGQTGNLLRTEVHFAEASAPYTLTSATTPIELDAYGQFPWQIWFRDLPMQNGTFDRSTAQSLKAEDINDPEALGRQHNVLNGYEWRLRGVPDEILEPPTFLAFFNLQFYPLTLDQVQITGEQLEHVAISGRLQLPLSGEGELAEFGSVVQLHFQTNSPGGALACVAIKPVSGVGVWPLALTNGESGDAPRLEWSNISLTPDRQQLKLDGVRLRYLLFDQEWSVQLAPILFNRGPDPVSLLHTFPTDPLASIAPQTLQLVLDPIGFAHGATFGLNLRLGKPAVVPGLRALYTFNEGAGNVIRDVSGVGEPLDLHIGDAAAVQWKTGALTVKGATTIRSARPAAELRDALQATNELTIEAWITPAKTSLPASAPIVTLSTDQSNIDMAMQQGQPGQSGANFFRAQLRTMVSSNASVATSTGSVKKQLTHLVVTHNVTGETRIYVDGAQRAQDTIRGDFSTWHDSFVLALANETAGKPAWQGDYHRLAVYDRALEPSEIAQHFTAGPEPQSEAARRTFTADVVFDLLHQPGGVSWQSGTLFDDLVLDVAAASGGALILRDQSFQFAWQSYLPRGGTAPQLLPGMPLAAGPVPGYTIVSFTATPLGELPKLRIDAAFVEVLLACRWGNLRPDGPGLDVDPYSQLFSSSAGDLAVGYTAQVRTDVWHDDLLLNGFVEVRNLLSWPLGHSFDDANGRLSLPPTRGSNNPPLDHLRHTIRVLLNQHQIPTTSLMLGHGALLFNLQPHRSWQTLTVVEHQLEQVFTNVDRDVARGGIRRWTALQEVRFTGAQSFKRFLLGLRSQKYATLTPDDGVNPFVDSVAGYLGGALRTLFADGNAPVLDTVPTDTLLVEASAAHWVNLTPLGPAGSTSLQFLPGGTQLATLSNPDVYGPTDPQDPRWLLLIMPFIGRLQPLEHDGLNGQSAGTSLLAIDPLVQLLRNRVSKPSTALAPLLLALAHRGDISTVTINVAGFDTAAGRTFARLDALSLEENWFRLQHPVPESSSLKLQHVLAALPNTPARLSRPVALTRAFQSTRASYPPSSDSGANLSSTEPSGTPVWREQSLLVVQSMTKVSGSNPAPYGWTLTGLQILTSGLLPAGPAAHTEPVYFAAATLLPALLTVDGQPNLMPVSYAVSPYVALQWRPGGSTTRLRLVSAELLCLDPHQTHLLPVANHVWELTPSQDEAMIRNLANTWAIETRRRLAPQSVVALIRYREIRDNINLGSTIEATLTTTYTYALVDDSTPSPKLAGRVFRLRADVDELRFRQGQYGGSRMPTQTRAFELAPPLVTGMQAVYATDRPVVETSSTWPWGLSALRISVQYTAEQSGALGPLSGHAVDDAPLALWWQAAQHHIQWRSAIRSTRPTGGLPARFRAKSIHSLLPVLPQPKLPPLASLNLGGADDPQLEAWQPVLPGALRFLMTGSRPGVMVALRAQLMRQQRIRTFAGQPSEDVLVSGSVPVQHRTPRPVPLPHNSNINAALRTWASAFEPQHSLLDTTAPADEAFLASSGVLPARRLRMTLEAPAYGGLGQSWNGELVFKMEATAENQIAEVGDWSIVLTLSDGQQTFDYEAGVPIGTTGNYRFDPKTAVQRERLATTAPGTVVIATARVAYTKVVDDFAQTLQFPLRLIDEAVPRLPLEPHFVLFEDPEYNRRLASATALAAQFVKIVENGQQRTRTVTLGSDRRDYNPDSPLALMYNWDDQRVTGTATLSLRLVEQGGNIRALVLDEAGAMTVSLAPRRLRQFTLNELQRLNAVLFVPGMVLQLRLIVETTPIVLNVNIVAEPVVPVTEAAYALLRGQIRSERSEVECVCFAWSPEPQRIELVAPDDLTTGIVRRRAVFHWYDAVRPITGAVYALQKVTHSGATHIPELQVQSEKE